MYIIPDVVFCSMVIVNNLSCQTTLGFNIKTFMLFLRRDKECSYLLKKSEYNVIEMNGMSKSKKMIGKAVFFEFFYPCFTFLV